jgi:DNA-binding transcriptional regulator GbsR (MarR family)
MYPYEIRRKAIELSKTRSAGQTLKALKRLPEFENEDMPDTRTISRWKNQAERLERQISESQEYTKETARKYWETHPIPKWLKDLYLVKIENGEIKPL